MGCNAAVDPQCKADEKPQHLVSILPVAIDRFEVSVGAYGACVKAGKCVAAGKGKLGDGLCNSGLAYADLQPINCVNAAQAEQYCAWKGGRLPTEAEWELLARGACSTPLCKSVAFRFPWGNLPLPAADCAMAWIAGNVASGCNQGTTLETGAKIADKSPWGGYDLGGNLQEWTADGYKADFYSLADASKPSPKAPVSLVRVVRGGGGASKPADVRTSARFPADATTSSPWIGFRCVGVVGK